MSSGNLRLIAALGIVAILSLVIGFGIWPEQPKLISYSVENPRTGDYRPGGEDCQPATLASIADSEEQARQIQGCREMAEQYRLDTNDLIQQTRAANATEAQAHIANEQLWIGWVQTLGGFLTLAAAVGAAIYAREAARQTNEANRIARNSERAWIGIDDAEPVELTANVADNEVWLWVNLSLSVENRGRKPALDLVASWEFHTDHDQVPQAAVQTYFDSDMERADRSGHHIEPGGRKVFSIGTMLKYENYDAQQMRRFAMPSLVVSFTYFDGVNAERRQTGLVYSIVAWARGSQVEAIDYMEVVEKTVVRRGQLRGITAILHRWPIGRLS